MTAGEANIVIVGGGVVGLSCAWELARSGVDGIVVFDKYGPATGTTGGSAGVICPVELGELYMVMGQIGFSGIMGLVSGAGLKFTSAGSLHVIYDDDPQAYHEAAKAQWKKYGGGSGSMLLPEFLSDNEVVKRMPWVRRSVSVGETTRRVTGGIFYPNQGFINPFQLVRIYEDLARAAGVELQWCTPVLQMRSGSGRVFEVVTRRGVWGCEKVLNAGGPWGRKVAAAAGVDIPLTPQRIQVCVAEQGRAPIAPLTGVPEAVLGEGVWCRGEEGGMLLFGQHHHTTQAGFTVDPDFVDRGNELDYPDTVRKTYQKYWSVADHEFLAGWSCVYGTTTDGYPIVCRDTQVENLYHAVGMNGHGITVHPAVAALMRSLIVDGSTRVELTGVGAAINEMDGSALRADRRGLAPSSFWQEE